MKRFALLFLIAVFALSLLTGCDHNIMGPEEPGPEKIGRVKFRSDFFEKKTLLYPGARNFFVNEIVEAVGGRLPESVVFSSSDTAVFEVRNVFSGQVMLLSKKTGQALLRFVTSEGQKDSALVEVVRRFDTDGLQPALMFRVEFADTTYEGRIFIQQKGEKIDRIWIARAIGAGAIVHYVGFGFVRSNETMTIVINAQMPEFGWELLEAEMKVDGYYSATGTFKTMVPTPTRPLRTGKCSLYLKW